MGSDFVPSFLVEKECTIKAGLLACLMIADVKKNRDATDLAALQPYTADVNHNVLQKNTLAEIVNNSIGNIAGVKGLPDSSLNNDKLYILMGNIVSVGSFACLENTPLEVIFSITSSIVRLISNIS